MIIVPDVVDLQWLAKQLVEMQAEARTLQSDVNVKFIPPQIC